MSDGNPTFRVGQYVRFGEQPQEAEYREQAREVEQFSDEDSDTRVKLGWAAGYRAGNEGLSTDPTNRDIDWQLAFHEGRKFGSRVAEGQAEVDDRTLYRLGWDAGYRTARGDVPEHFAKPEHEAWQAGYSDGAKRGKRECDCKSNPPSPDGFIVRPISL